MGRVWKQLSLLLWKNFLLQKRKPISTAVEILLPILFVAILLVLRLTSVKSYKSNEQRWSGFQIKDTLPGDITQRRPNPWKVAFAPNDTRFFDIMTKGFSKFSSLETVSFANDQDMLDNIKADLDEDITKQKYLCGVIFTTDPKEKHVQYYLRFPADARSNYMSKEEERLGSGRINQWFTTFVFPRTFGGLGARSNNSKYGGPPYYYEEGFTTIQKAVDFAIIGDVTSNKNNTELPDVENLYVEMRRFPYPEVVIDPFIIAIQNSLPLLLMLSLLYSSLSMVKNIVVEKEKRLKESMKMMGLSSWLHWVAWFIECFLLLLIPLIAITVMLCVSFGGNGKMLKASDGLLVFVFLLLYFLATIMFSFLVSTIFYRANVAAAASGILWFVTYIPYFFLAQSYNDLSKTSKVAACLDFNVAMAFGSFLIGQWEGEGSGVQWSNLGSGVTIDDNFTMGNVLLMLFLDCLIYGLLTWYIEAVFPGEYGIPRKFYFPFQKSYWCSVQQHDKDGFEELHDNVAFIEDVEEEGMLSPSHNPNFEKFSTNVKIGIKIKNLKKQFVTPQGTKKAVDGVSLNFYEGEITALLGHNGAGKTTTISMLTGLFPPTSGNAVINGNDIMHNMETIRESLGICPQHNVLFDLLTVEEHLWFFTCLKGVDDKKSIQREVDEMIESLALLDKRKTQSKNLSGGMKRKLSVGNALVGNSKVVILDEPTSGMDVSARRFTWDLLQRERKGRTILLTTHFMDEADVLGDKIAIMASGRVQCYGSSLFLKKRYGVGYHMVMVKTPDCDVEKVSNLILGYIPTAELESDIGLELSFILPSDYSNQFEKLFSEIEERREELGISSFGASVTTLEEVFIKVGDQDSHEGEQNKLHKDLFRQLSEKDKDQEEPSSGLSETRQNFELANDSLSDATYRPNTGFALFKQRWWAMFVKKVTHSKRYRISLIAQLLMPCFFTMMSLLVVRSFPRLTDEPSITLSPNMFGKTYSPYSVNQSLLSNVSTLTTGFRTYVNMLDDSNPTFVTTSMINYLMSQQTPANLPRFNKEYEVALEVGNNTLNGNKAFSLTAWFNNEAFHTPGISINMLSNSLLQAYLGGQSDYKISTINFPLPPNSEQRNQQSNQNMAGFQIAFNLCLGMAFLASSFILFLVQERASKAKLLQFVSGVDPVSYWTSAYLWDLINYVVPCACIVLLFAIFQEEAFMGERLGYVALLLLLHGWAIIPLMYIFSFLFVVSTTAFTRMTMLNVCTGLAALLVIFILGILGENDIRDICKWIFLFMPSFNLGEGIVDMSTNYMLRKSFSVQSIVSSCAQLVVQSVPAISRKTATDICSSALRTYDNRGSIDVGQCEKDLMNKFKMPLPYNMLCESIQHALDKATQFFQWNYLAWEAPGIGRYLIFLTIEGVLFFTIVLLIEYGFFRALLDCRKGKSVVVVRPEGSTCGSSQASLDSDVLAEQQRVLQQGDTGDALVMKEVTKVFRVQGNPLVAVDHLSLGIPHGECFGLLGQNGAGKTTTFRILTGDETMTSGSAYIDSFDVTREFGKVRQRMGYCPQFDALIDLMTGRELLWMYCRLRGVPEEQIPACVNKLAQDLGVQEHIDKFTKTYSGGNKRKLSTAIALCGDPLLIFLDEPSSGMDPVAQRNMWNSISRVIASGKSIVLTSHSMEECEALCTRLAIMVNGQFKCLGSPQHLKTKFGEGYTLIAKIGVDSVLINFKSFVEMKFPGSLLKDEHQGYIHYQLKTDQSWGQLFGIMERAKDEYNIEDYSISQTTLEQVFLNFTKAQREAGDD